MDSININHKAACGFPSPADDHIEHDLDLNQYLIQHPAATFFLRAEGLSMREIGILDGDLLIVDRSALPRHNSIVVVAVNGEFTIKRLKIISGKGFLCAANNTSKPLSIEGIQMWGVVTHAIHDVRAI